jgi:hypothetical protein
MRTSLVLSILAAFVILIQSAPHAGQQAGARLTPAAETALAEFLSAPSPQAAESAAAAVLKSSVNEEAARERLARGRTYSAEVARGIAKLSHRIGANEFGYSIEVPASYDPRRKYQVRFQLHGGVTGRQDGAVRGAGGIGSLAGAEQIYVLPNAWNDVPWWGAAQMESLGVILDRLKRSYNVDENRVVVSGVSDGGTAAYYVAMHETTPFASFLPLNGALLVLTNESLNIESDLFPNNLLDKPFFVVNGGRDPLYPPSIVEPYVEHLKAGGVDLSYHPQPTGVHNTAWWPDVKNLFETFVAEHPRTPHPAKLTWQTDGKDTDKRAHWIVIDEPKPTDAREPLADLNRLVPPPLSGFGLRMDGRRVTSVAGASSASTFDLRVGDEIVAIDGKAVPDNQTPLQFLQTFPAGNLMTFTVVRDSQRTDLRGYFSPGSAAPRPIFGRSGPSGRVDVVRNGNRIEATTRGVAAFTLLLSADVIDFSKPVTVVVDGRTQFEGALKRSVETLMKWAARDNDRTMLYDAELTLKVP